MQHNITLAKMVIDIFTSITGLETGEDFPIEKEGDDKYTFDPKVLEFSDESYETDKPILNEPIEGTQNVIILGEYHRMSSPAKVILYSERIKRRTARLLRDYGSIVKRNLSYSEVLRICEISALEVFVHERFHFATDLYGKLYNSFNKNLEEESFATAFSYLFLIDIHNLRSSSYSNDNTINIKRSLNVIKRDQLFPFRNYLYRRKFRRNIGINRKDELVFNQIIIDLIFNGKTLPFYKDWEKVIIDFTSKLLDYLDAKSLRGLYTHDLNPEQILNHFLANCITFDGVKLEIDSSY